jgi:hypothetical protein
MVSRWVDRAFARDGRLGVGQGARDHGRVQQRVLDHLEHGVVGVLHHRRHAI